MGKGGRKLTNGIDGRAKGRTLLLNTPTGSGKRLTKGFEKTHLSFSFLYFRQIPFFELDDQDNRWFVSLLERLKDLSGKNSSILGDTTAKQAYRIHPIAWTQTNIPIKKSDLDWIPKEYLDNTEIEFLQFEITQSTGRVVGFFNETNEVFNIVLLDPKHNIQPTKSTGYKVDKTHYCPTDYEELLEQLNTGSASEKHISRSAQVVWIEEDLLQVFYKYKPFDLCQELEEFLLSKI